jgi:putative transposase
LNLSRDERVCLIEREGEDLSVRLQTELLSLNRSGIYYHPQPPSAAEVQLKHRIDEIYTKCPFYGSRKITAQLQQEGIEVNRKAIQRHMREMGIEGIHPGPNLSKRTQKEGIFPYLLRHTTSQYPNHIWGLDITYIRLRGGWMYLVAVLDWYSRYVVSWELDQTLELPFVLTALERALTGAAPTICNSDQGSHFTSLPYRQLLQAAEVQISMDGRGRAFDNIFTERLWRTIKYEEVYLHEYGSPKEARMQLKDYLQFYNHQRLHQSLGYCSPASVYFAPIAQGCTLVQALNTERSPEGSC